MLSQLVFAWDVHATQPCTDLIIPSRQVRQCREFEFKPSMKRNPGQDRLVSNAVIGATEFTASLSPAQPRRFGTTASPALLNMFGGSIRRMLVGVMKCLAEQRLDNTKSATAPPSNGCGLVAAGNSPSCQQGREESHPIRIRPAAARRVHNRSYSTIGADHRKFRVVPAVMSMMRRSQASPHSSNKIDTFPTFNVR